MSGPRVSPDIIERLRVWPAGYGEDTLSSTIVGSLMKDAADEIERLRHDNAALTLQVSNAAKEVNRLHGAAQAQSSGDFYLVPREIIDQFPEINVNNYDHDDACALNAWGCEVVTQSAPAFNSSHNSGESDLRVTADCAGADTSSVTSTDPGGAA